MGTNKERIERLEDGLQDGARIPSGSITNREGNGGGRLVVSSKTAKLEFPRFSGDDPTEWFNRVNQFFEFQNTPEAHKVSLASYHLEGEANQWWQWIRRTFQEEGRVLSWTNFEDELWARFGPSECEDFDEALSRIRQVGSLRDYQREFERLGNRVQGWTQRALVGTFMGGLRPDISDGIRMFKPQTLKEAIGLARMKDDQLARQRRFGRLAPPTRAPLTLPPTQLATPPAPAAPVRRLSWEEMQRRRAQNLCFNCNDRFAGHKCRDHGYSVIKNNQLDKIMKDLRTRNYTTCTNGMDVPKTMRIVARIGAHDVVVLIDSGSTHNFISECMANLLRLPVVPTESFTVRVANGENLRCQGGLKRYKSICKAPFFFNLLFLTSHRKLVGIDGQHIQVASIEELTKEIRPSHAQFALCLQVAHTEPQNIHSSMQRYCRILDFSASHQSSQKGPFGWHGEAETAFLALKQAMTTTPILAMPNFNDAFTIETDASGEGIGAVLSQQGKPVAYMSRALGVTKKSWSTYAKEMLAIVEAIPDALSRKQGSPILHNIFFPNQFIHRRSVWPRNNTEDHIHGAKGYYYTKEGSLFDALPYTPNCYEMHDTKVGVIRAFYWHGMHKSMQDYVKGCAVCQKIKAETLAPAGLLQPLPIPCQVWDDITLDFIEGLPISQGKDTIMVVVDRLSKSAHFLTLSHPFTAKTVAEKFVEGVFKLHGMPNSIISDRDPIFISNFWKEFFTMSGSKLQLSSAYHPQTDGQTEVINRCVEQYLRSFVHQWPRRWSGYLPWAEYWYNTTYHISTGMTPFQALYGRLSPPIPPYKDGLSPVHEVDQQLLNRDELLRQLKVNLERSVNRMKQMADRKRRDISFEVVEQVLLKLHPYRQSGLQQVHQKLASRTRSPVFHVSLLKRYQDNGGLAETQPAEIPPFTDGRNYRWIKQGTQLVEEGLVGWKHLPAEEATWEPTNTLRRCSQIWTLRTRLVASFTSLFFMRLCLVLRVFAVLFTCPLFVSNFLSFRKVKKSFVIQSGGTFSPKRNYLFILVLSCLGPNTRARTGKEINNTTIMLNLWLNP
ncbi:hypothetical protein AAG906_017119 [Vitis piasezkii]